MRVLDCLSRSSLIALCLITVIAAALGAQDAMPPNAVPTLRVTTQGVNVDVVVADSHGRPLNGLRPKDFRVFDNGIERPVLHFVPNEEASRVVLLIENGTEDYLLAKLGKSLPASAAALLDGVSAQDEVAIVTYSKQLDLLLPFTADKSLARSKLEQLGLGQLHSRSVSSGELNLSGSLAATIGWLASYPGSKTIVLLSTGMDTSPPQSWQAVQQRVKTSDVRILAVSMWGDFRKPPKLNRYSTVDRHDIQEVQETIRDSDRSLRWLVEATGGHLYLPTDVVGFNSAYAQVAQLARGSYTLEFAPTEMDGKVHTLRVEVAHPWGYHVDSRQAYLAEP